VLLVLAVAPLWTDRLARKVEVRTETDTADAFRLQQHLFELVTSPGPAKEIRVARVAEEIARRQSAAWQQATTRRFAARLRGAGLRALGWCVFVTGFAFALGWLIRQAASGATSVGDVIMVVTLSTAMQQQVQNVVGQFTTAMSSSMIIEPYLWLRAYSDEQRAASAGTEAPPATLHDGICLRGLTYTYPGATSPAVSYVDVTLPAGSIVALVGEHGSGKTTLVKLLCKFYELDSGTITVDGTDLAALDTASWRRRMSAAFQDFGRYPQATFAESVGLGDVTRMADQDALAGAIRAADAERVVARLPRGSATVLSPKYGGVDLSEGQWQKAALARACMRGQPLLFVLDEPTASLDAPSEHAIFEQYMAQAREQGARAGAITLIVSHRLSTVAGADLVLVLAEGRLVEQGTHTRLLRDGGRYSQMYGLQAQAYDQSRTTVG
jgi:ATP-binding cassette subfamily B protein